MNDQSETERIERCGICGRWRDGFCEHLMKATDDDDWCGLWTPRWPRLLLKELTGEEI